MTESLLSGLVPIWIIGAPLQFAEIELMRTPKPSEFQRTNAMPPGAYSAAAGRL